MSLIYHVYDPDDEISKRHSAGAQIIGPNGEYIYKESRKVRENFKAEAHELALQLEFDTAVKKPKLDTNRKEFYRVSDRGTKHAGYICTSESNKNDINLLRNNNDFLVEFLQ